MNRQENLFPLKNPGLILKSLNFLIILNMIWSILTFSQFFKEIIESKFLIGLFVLASLMEIIILFYLIPVIIKKLAVNTNVVI